ncbi:hypothetical protein ACHAXT_001188 [Thalassiosira profunda]
MAEEDRYDEGEAQMEEEEEEEEEEGEPLPPKVEELAQAPVPDQLKGVRSCMRCGLVKTLDQFLEYGCENCPYLDMAGNHERCNLCTTAFFEGQAAVMDPGESWAAKWLRVDAHLPGVYAISITGQFDKEIEEELENRGVRWRCRPVGSDPAAMP